MKMKNPVLNMKNTSYFPFSYIEKDLKMMKEC